MKTRLPIVSALTFAGAVAAAPATTTASVNPSAATPSTCPSQGAKYYIKGSGSGTAADGTYMQGGGTQPHRAQSFNTFPSLYSLTSTTQAYYFDSNTNFWFDSVFYFCVDHSSNQPHQVQTCQPTDFNNGNTFPLTCSQSLYGGTGSKTISCTTTGTGSGVTWDTFYVNNVSNNNGQVEQILSIGTAADASSLGRKISLTPEQAKSCGV